MNITLIILVIFSVIYCIFIMYQLMQFYYTIHPYKACLLDSNALLVGPELINIIQTYSIDTTTHSFIELGSGRAHVCRLIAKDTDFNAVIGVEGDFITYSVSRFLTWLSSTQISLVYSDIFRYRIEGKGNVVYCYLFPRILKKLYEDGLLQGQLVVSLTFEITGVTPTETITIPNFQKCMYVYDFRDA